MYDYNDEIDDDNEGLMLILLLILLFVLSCLLSIIWCYNHEDATIYFINEYMRL